MSTPRADSAEFTAAAAADAVAAAAAAALVVPVPDTATGAVAGGAVDAEDGGLLASAEDDNLNKLNGPAPATSGGRADLGGILEDSEDEDEEDFPADKAAVSASRVHNRMTSGEDDTAPLSSSWRRVALVAAAAFTMFIAGFVSYRIARAQSDESAASMLMAVYESDDPRARTQEILIARGATLPTAVATRSPSPTPTSSATQSVSASPAPTSSSSSSSVPIGTAAGDRVATLTCHDPGDGDACNGSLPSEEQLQPFRKPGWGVSRCAMTNYPQPYTYHGAFALRLRATCSANLRMCVT